MNKIMSVVVIISFLVLGTSIAEAKVVWSYNAMASVPAGASMNSGLYDSLAGRVIFKKGKTGTIALICPISDDLGKVSLRSLRLTYRDGDGRQGPSVVSASIRRVKKSNGSVATLRNGTVSSNDSNAVNSGPTGWVTHQSGSPGRVLSHVLDLDNYYYYVQINLKRTDAAVPLGVLGVHLIN